MSFAYDSCIGCSRRWSPTDTRKGNEWWPLRDQDIQRWCCYRCISRAWRHAAPAGKPGYSGSCASHIEEALRTIEFQNEIRYILNKHKWDCATEPNHPTYLDHCTAQDHATGADNPAQHNENADSLMDVE